MSGADSPPGPPKAKHAKPAAGSPLIALPRRCGRSAKRRGLRLRVEVVSPRSRFCGRFMTIGGEVVCNSVSRQVGFHVMSGPLRKDNRMNSLKCAEGAQQVAKWPAFKLAAIVIATVK